jgi:D-amino-acid dehydrogenase
VGVTFRYGVDVRGLQVAGGRVVAVDTAEGPVTADGFVVALGSFSPMMVRPLGMNLPVYPVKGYSITVPIRDEGRAPVSTVMDETHKIAITRLGDRIRVGGMAELAGFDMSLSPRRRATLEHSVEDLFGGAGDQSRASFWCGLRPMTPDGTPVVGKTPIANLYLNTGHGTLGWTMAAGSGKLLADIISGARTDIDATDLGYARYVRDAKRGMTGPLVPVAG